MKKILKKYFSLVVEGSLYGEEPKRTWSADERDKAFAYVRDEGVYFSSYGNMQFPIYSLLEMTEYKEYGDEYFNKHHCKYGFALKEDTIEKYNLTEIDDYCNENKAFWSVYYLAKDFGIPFMSFKTKDGITKHYINFPMFEKLIQAVNTKKQPYVLDGTDWPYWFDFEGKLLPSNTSNWFKYLQIKFDYISPTALVPYKGEDKYDEHMTDETKA